MCIKWSLKNHEKMTLTTPKYTIANYDKTMTNVSLRSNTNHHFLITPPLE